MKLYKSFFLFIINILLVYGSKDCENLVKYLKSSQNDSGITSDCCDTYIITCDENNNIKEMYVLSKII